MDVMLTTRDILSSRGLSWLPGSHMNSHTSDDREDLDMKKIFDGVSKPILRSAFTQVSRLEKTFHFFSGN